MSELNIPDLNIFLKHLVKWQIFALYLPRIVQSDIDTIERNKRDDNDDQKIALYTKWLNVYPDASWEDVIIALQKAKENRIATELRKKFPIVEAAAMSPKKPNEVYN